MAQTPLFENYTSENGLVSDYVYCVFEDSKGFIWASTNNGVSKFDGFNFENYTTINGLSDNEILNVFEDKNGRVWFLCFNGKVCFYYNGKIYNEHNTNWLKSINSKDRIIDFYESDSLFFLNKNHCYVLDSENKVTTLLKGEADSTAYLSIIKIYKKLHVLTNRGLIKFDDIKKGKIKFNEFDLLSRVYHHGADNNLTLATGLQLLYYAENKLTKIDISNYIQGVTEIDSIIYVSTSKSLFKFCLLELLLLVFERKEADFAGIIGNYLEKFNELRSNHIHNIKK